MKLKTQLFFILFAITAFLVLSIELFSAFFFEGFYFRYKEDVLFSSYQRAHDLYLQQNPSWVSLTEEIEQEKNVRIMLFDADYDLLFGRQNSREKNRSFPRMREFNARLVEGASETPAVRINRNQKNNARFLTLLAVFYDGSGNPVYAHVGTSVNAMNDSISVVKKFIHITSLAVLLLGALVIYWTTGAILRPLDEIIKMTEKMSGLDFSNRIKIRGEGEIARLGGNINMLSGKLKRALDDLHRANEKLKADILRKENIDRARKTFISNVSHELKTPLALIAGYAEGLQMNVTEDRDYYCEVICGEVKKMNNIVMGLLDISELEAGYLKLSPAEFSPAELAAEVVEKYGRLFAEREIAFACELSFTGKVCADPFRIEQVLTNYLNNALKHMDEEKRIAVSVTERPGGRVRVCVENSGAPVREEDRERIWDSFYKVVPQETGVNGGSGLGLSIVKAIMDAHGGSFGLENGDGSVCFWFELKGIT